VGLVIRSEEDQFAAVWAIQWGNKHSPPLPDGRGKWTVNECGVAGEGTSRLSPRSRDHCTR
jgi:hypothetical protein